MRSLSYAGPWLLERTALEELGVVVDELWRRYGPGDEVAADSYSNIKRVRIGKKGAPTVTAATVEEAIHLQSQGGDVANSFNVELRTKSGSVELSIDNEVFGGSVLTLSGSSPGTMAAEAMYGALRNWVEDHRAPLWQRVWSWLPPWHWLVWWFGLSMLVSLTPVPNATAIYKEQAATILVDGISSEETEQAIEVLLRMQADIVADEMRPTKPPFWVKPYFDSENHAGPEREGKASRQGRSRRLSSAALSGRGWKLQFGVYSPESSFPASPRRKPMETSR